MLREDFVSGSQWYLDSLPDREEKLPRIAVTVIVEGYEIVRLLDTGANQCVLSWSAAVPLASLFEAGEAETRALGGNVIEGKTIPVDLTFLAHEGVQRTIRTFAWASEEFHGPSLIGYGGLLEKIRFAVDPDRNLFYFGGA